MTAHQLSDTSDGAFMRCNRCRMEIRRTEMEIHLSHAHDIGPMSGKKERKDKGGRAPRRNSD